MFGKNEIVGQKYFKDAPADSLFVTSMFMTLQGEGPFAGRPAFFIRLAKCNLACSFCDTFFDDGDWMTYDQIFERITETINKAYNDNPPEYALIHPASQDRPFALKRDMVLVITGGEPSLQKNLVAFLEQAQDQFTDTQIESNGILYLEDLPYTTTLVVSPKCVEKNGKAIRYIKPNPHTLNRANALKFVVEADPESPYHDIPEWADSFGGAVYVSPMNVYNSEPSKSKQLRNTGKNKIDIEERSTVDEVISFWEPGLLNMTENQNNHEYAARLCMKRGFTLNLQMHLYASLA